MDDYRNYLAQTIITEDQLVTYRLLSRALRVHANTAKEMLFEFHKWQNDKRPGSLHATYLIYGTKSPEKAIKAEEPDGDVEMTDSQNSGELHAHFSDDVPTYTLSLVKEEQLQDVLAEYDNVTSIHVHSLAPHPLKDLQLLAETSRQDMKSSTGDVSSSSKVFGSIINTNVRRRERRGGTAKLAASTPALRAVPKTENDQEVKSATVKEESKVPPQADVKGSTSTAPAKKPVASMKRQGSSTGIGQMFAKAAAKPKKPAAKTVEQLATKKAEEEDQKMALSDDGEDDSEPETKQETNISRQSRKDRQAELRRMMEESDEEEPEKPESPVEEPMQEEEEEEEGAPQPESKPKVEEPAEIVSSTGDGRRRGRRRVTRKKQVMDDKNYLVTIQEQVWESFSEDEAPPAPKAKTPPVKAEPAAKSKKPAAKGQGNIMSFFSKK